MFLEQVKIKHSGLNGNNKTITTMNVLNNFIESIHQQLFVPVFHQWVCLMIDK